METMHNKQDVRNILFQIWSFLVVSGVGWMIDFGIYFMLTKWLNFHVVTANCISSAPAVLWVFLFSSKKIFSANRSGFKLYQKYLIYFSYQILLISVVSFLAGYLYIQFMSSEFIGYKLLYDNIKTFIKIVITPLTMTMNFIVMKSLIEKL